MKFNSELTSHQNIMARQEYYLNAPRTDYDSLSEAEKAWLRLLNDQLREIEEKYLPIMVGKLKELEARESDPSDWMEDFNLSFLITIYLRKDDPEYEENDDNILMEYKNKFFRYSTLDLEWGFGATCVNYAVSCEYFAGEHHCYLYYQLYHHCCLDWRDLFRIGSLYVDIKIEEQSGMLPVVLINQI